jgi:hypothetical protein
VAGEWQREGVGHRQDQIVRLCKNQIDGQGLSSLPFGAVQRFDTKAACSAQADMLPGSKRARVSEGNSQAGQGDVGLRGGTGLEGAGRCLCEQARPCGNLACQCDRLEDESDTIEVDFF